MALKGKIEAIIYAAEEPVTLEQISLLLKEPVLQELAEEQARLAAEMEAAAEQSGMQQDDEPFFAMQESQPVGGGIERVEEGLDPSETSELNIPPDDANAEAQPNANGQNQAELPEGTPVGDCQTHAPEEPSGQAAVHHGGEAAAAEAAQNAPLPVAPKKRSKADIPPEVRSKVRALIEELIGEYASPDRGIEIRHIAGGYRMATKPEHHDVVKAFAKSLKPPFKLSLPALETLAVVAYKQPVTAPEVGEIRGVDSQGVMATLLDRKLITTAGRKAVIGRPILYKTTKEFLLRFGLKDVNELPSMEEFEKLALEAGQVDMFAAEETVPDSAAPSSSPDSELQNGGDPVEVGTDAASEGALAEDDAEAAAVEHLSTPPMEPKAEDAKTETLDRPRETSTEDNTEELAH